jgi:hypothetical protein
VQALAAAGADIVAVDVTRRPRPVPVATLRWALQDCGVVAMADASDLDDALIAAGLAEERDIGEGEIAVLPVAGVTLDRIGPIPAQVDEEGVILRPGDNRYHANLRVSFELTKAQEDELPTFTPTPGVPYRVFI